MGEVKFLEDEFPEVADFFQKIVEKKYPFGIQKCYIHEHNIYVMVNGRYTLMDNIIPGGSVSVKIGRNDPCSCGSGKKFKKCCG